MDLDYTLGIMEKAGIIKITDCKNDDGEDDKMITLNDEYLIFNDSQACFD